MEAGVGIEFEENNILFKINKKITLQENIDEICKRNGLVRVIINIYNSINKLPLLIRQTAPPMV